MDATLSSPSPQPSAVPRVIAFGTLLAGVALLFLACRAWAMGETPLGERHFTPARIWAARAAAGALFAMAHAALLGVALPLIYRPRAAYAALAGALGLAAALAGVTAAALYAAATGAA